MPSESAGPGRVAVLVNPAAGRGRAGAAGEEVAAALRSAGRQVEVLTGHSAAESTSLARAAASGGAAIVVACGGDGILHSALQAVAGTDVALGLVACGNGNDFARSLDLPVNDPARAARIVLAGRTRHIDLLRVDGDNGEDQVRYVGTVLACGFDSRVADRAALIRWPRGRSRYQLAMVAELAAFRPIDFTVTLDGVMHQWPAMLVAIGNGPFYGGGMKMCPSADLQDGALDVTVITALSRRRLVRLFPSVYRGEHTGAVEVLTFRAGAITVHAAATTAYGDGEFVSALPVSGRVMAGAVRVLTE